MINKNMSKTIEKLLLPLLLNFKADASRNNNNNNPENGDVIRVNRGVYSHYGIYVKDINHVIHYTGATGPADFNGIVRETSLNEFLNGAKSFSVCHFPENPSELVNKLPANNGGRIFQLWQAVKAARLKDYHLYSGDETIMRARSKLGEGGYNLAFNNCEHFAVWCKTGEDRSSQVSAYKPGNLVDGVFSAIEDLFSF